MKLTLDIRANEGYSTADACLDGYTITVGELRAMMEGYDDDVQIFTNDLNNRRGAHFGRIVAECLDEVGDDEDEDE